MKRVFKLGMMSIIALTLLSGCLTRIYTIELYYQYISVTGDKAPLTPTWGSYILDKKITEGIEPHKTRNYFVAGDFISVWVDKECLIQESYPSKVIVPDGAKFLNRKINYAETIEIETKDIRKQGEDYFYNDYQIINPNVITNINGEYINFVEVTSSTLYMSIQSDIEEVKNIGFSLYAFNPNATK